MFLLLMEQSLYMALMISHYVQTGIEVKMGTLVKSGCVDTPYIWVPCKCGVGLLHKRAFLFIFYALCSNTHPYTSRDKISTVEIAIKSVPCTLEYSQTAVPAPFYVFISRQSWKNTVPMCFHLPGKKWETGKKSITDFFTVYSIV